MDAGVVKALVVAVRVARRAGVGWGRGRGRGRGTAVRCDRHAN